MTLRLFLAFVLLLAAGGCGVKGDLEKPGGQPMQKTEKDNSKPPFPVGR